MNRQLASRRPGAALVMALLTIVVLDCIVLGTLHLALQEQRIGSNRAAVLQLRLDAESGARLALGSWTADLDSMARGSAHRIRFPASATAGARVDAERLGDHLFLLESAVAEPPPRAGRSVVRLLIHPPAIPPDVEVAPAPISSAGPVHVTGSGVVASSAPSDCVVAPPVNGILAPPFGVTTEPGGTLDAPAGLIPPRNLTVIFGRLADLALPQFVAYTDSTVTTDIAGVLIVAGNVTIAADTEFTGLLVASGIVTIAAGSHVVGAVHAGDGVILAGRAQWDPCAVATAVRQAGLDRPQPAAPRAWVPAF